MPLKATASIAFHSQIRNMQTDNVLALMPGTTRKDEAIVYSAHWDHFGRDPALKGDQIYNGAVDNGTGLSALLEIADAFAHQNPPPQRSILFLAPTMEEAGLLGSQYYTLHPAFPMTRTVAEINMDELIPFGRTHNMAIIGFGQSQMDQYLADALKPQSRTISADEEPEKGFFYRSDQLNFARLGVPVLYARGGFDKLDGGVSGRTRGLRRFHRTSLPQTRRQLRSELGFVRRDRRRAGAVRGRQTPRGRIHVSAMAARQPVRRGARSIVEDSGETLTRAQQWISPSSFPCCSPAPSSRR